jgi:hypothetical protein
VLVWIFYLCTTLFTQLTFFNMLIGIMGQTFERVTEGRERNSLMERTKMAADFIWLLKPHSKFRKQRYLYLVRPEEDEASNQFKGSIFGLKRQLTKFESKLNEQVVTQAQKVSAEVADHQMAAMSTLNERTTEIEMQVKNFKGKFEEILSFKDKFDEILTLLKSKK